MNNYSKTVLCPFLGSVMFPLERVVFHSRTQYIKEFVQKSFGLQLVTKNIKVRDNDGHISFANLTEY